MTCPFATMTKPGRYGRNRGLHLFVRDEKRRSWVLRYTAPDGRRRDMGLGQYPEVGLEEAELRAAECRRMVRDGIDPLDVRRAYKLVRDYRGRESEMPRLDRDLLARLRKNHAERFVHALHEKLARETFVSLLDTFAERAVQQNAP